MSALNGDKARFQRQRQAKLRRRRRTRETRAAMDGARPPVPPKTAGTNGAEQERPPS